MKKSLITVFLLLLINIFVFASCSMATLATPKSVYINTIYDALMWEEIDNANGYIIESGDLSYEVDTNIFYLANLPAGTHYLQVKAVGDGENADSSLSASVYYNKLDTSSLVFTPIYSNTEYEVSSMANADTSVIIPNTYNGLPVTRIGDKAFEKNTTLTDITFGTNITEIEEYAFYNCTRLSSAVFPEDSKLTTIGNNAFQMCASLQKIIIPDCVTSIGNYAFQRCDALSDVTISASLSEIPEYAFAFCISLGSLNLPNNITSIMDMAFYSCSNLVQVSLSENLTYLGYSAFADNGMLSEVAIPGSLARVGEYAFSNNYSLTTLTIESGVEVIGEQAFYNTSSLQNVTIADSVCEIEQYAFYDSYLYNQSSGFVYADKWLVGSNASSVTSLALASGTVGIANNVLMDISGVTGTSNIEVTLTGVKYIGDYNYMNNSSVRSIVLPDIISIGKYAFYNCTQLANFSLNAELQKIDTGAFNNTSTWSSSSGIVSVGGWVVGAKDSTVTSITIPEDTVGITDYAFLDMTSLSSVSLPSTLKYMGEGAFANCTSLSSIDMSETQLTVVEDYAFYGCTALSSVTFSDIVKIGNSAFYQTSSLQSIALPEMLTSIGDYAFYQSGLYTLTLPDSTKSLGAYAFFNNQKLFGINFGNGLETMGDYCFYRSVSLKDVSLPDSMVSIGDYAFYNSIEIVSFSSGDGLVDIGSFAFYRCTALSSVSLGSNIASIGDYAFIYCTTLSNIVFPTSLSFIGSYAFVGCSQLSSIILPNTLDNVGIYAFSGASNLTFYSEVTDYSGWATTWNGSNRPIVSGIQLSDDKTYISTIVMTDIVNYNDYVVINEPYREGYTFTSWMAVVNGSVQQYSTDELCDIPNSTILSATWQ